MKAYSISLLFLILLFTGCKKAPENFTLVFQMDNRNVYKSSIEIDHDKSYRIQQQNLFFDAYAGKEQFNNSEGKLSDEEFRKLTKLLAGGALFKMENTYGFGKADSINNDPLDDLIYHMNYKEGDKEKYILIHPNPSTDYPKNLFLLIKFLGDFTSERIKK